MQISTPVVILIVVAVIVLVTLVYFVSVRNTRHLRQDRLKYLLELESEALASEQTGPMAMGARHGKLDASQQNLPEGLILDTQNFNASQSGQKTNGMDSISASRKLEPFFDYIDMPLSWVRSYQQGNGERFDLRPSNGAAVIAIIEWHTNGWSSRRKAYAQVGDQYYIVTENLFNRIKVQKVEHGQQLAIYNRASSEIKFFGNRVFRWVISNPLEKPCAFIDQDGIEALVYTGSMSNIRVNNSNLDIVPVLLLLLIYEYRNDLNGLPFPTPG